VFSSSINAMGAFAVAAKAAIIATRWLAAKRGSASSTPASSPTICSSLSTCSSVAKAHTMVVRWCGEHVPTHAMLASASASRHAPPGLALSSAKDCSTSASCPEVNSAARHTHASGSAAMSAGCTCRILASAHVMEVRCAASKPSMTVTACPASSSRTPP